eukprot:SAG11_NODE_40208_length_207_cov_193.555556_1_plen_43_part_10
MSGPQSYGGTFIPPGPRVQTDESQVTGCASFFFCGVLPLVHVC